MAGRSSAVAPAVEHLDDVDLAVGAGPHDEAHGGRGAVGRSLVAHHDRIGHGDAGGHVDDHRVGQQGVVEPGEGVAVSGRSPRSSARLVAAEHPGPAQVAVVDGGGGAGGVNRSRSSSSIRL